MSKHTKFEKAMKIADEMDMYLTWHHYSSIHHYPSPPRHAIHCAYKIRKILVMIGMDVQEFLVYRELMGSKEEVFRRKSPGQGANAQVLKPIKKSVWKKIKNILTRIFTR